MSDRWTLQPLPPVLDSDLIQLVGKYAAKILTLRGINTPLFAKPFVFSHAYSATPATALPDMEIAVKRLLLAREKQEQVLIWGDFDCDGVTSTALLLSAMRSLGWQVDFTIPRRSTEGHGLNPQRLQQVLDQGVQLIVTVDCGVANHAEIAQAQAAGVDVVVTDHHLLPDPLPPATAVINPLRLPEHHPLRVLPGVGVAYKLAEALYQVLDRPDVEQLLDLAVVGIVADVAVLQRECRYLVQTGLPLLAHTAREGLRQLIQRHVKDQEVTAADIGYRIAPRLNAIGRLDDASLAVELLTTSDPERVNELIDHFETLNAERRTLTDQVVQEASQQIESLELQAQKAIVLASSGWHRGVVGIAAARLVDTYGCPTVLIASDLERNEGYGSGRSLPGVDLVKAMDAVQPLLAGYGGHQMAAGLRVELPKVEALCQALQQELAQRMAAQPGGRELTIEIVLDLSLGQSISKELDLIFEQLSLLEPFGHGNPRPVIALLNFQPSRYNPDLSRSGDHLYFKVGARRLWYWGAGLQQQELAWGSALDIAFVMEAGGPGAQPWRGIVKDVRLAGDWRLYPSRGGALEIRDYRGQKSLPAVAAVYDGFAFPAPAQELMLQQWPWFPQDLRQLLETVQPQVLVLAATSQDYGRIPAWISQLTQVWKPHSPLDLAQLDIPASLLAHLLSGVTQDQAPVQTWLQLLRESQSFHAWLDRASSMEILKLCKRLLSSPSSTAV
jgi:single-stranded-DNA-specific exonuclease